MPQAARVSDAHSCPLSTPTPHSGGVIVGGVGSVVIGHLPAATRGSACACGPGPANTLVAGSATVTIERQPAARVGDATSHGGAIVAGCGTVVIG